MPELVELDKDEGHDEVHHSGVELETEVGGTDVEDGAQQTLQNHRQTHRVEDGVLLRQPRVGFYGLRLRISGVNVLREEGRLGVKVIITSC